MTPTTAALPRRRLLQLGLAGLLLPAVHSSQAQISLSTAINRAARFRALSQRCAKAYCQVFLDVLPDSARDTLSAAQRLIQTGFEDLGKGTYPAPVAKQLQAVRQEATALAQLLGTAPSKASIGAVAAQADKMLTAANAATEALQQASPQPSAKLVNLAGRQRMLSQRLGKNYFLIAAGQDTKALRELMAADAVEFKESLATLANAPISTPSIRNELALGESQWTFFSAALQRKPDPEALRIVATTSERLLDVMNNLTNLYDAALKDLLGSA